MRLSSTSPPISSFPFSSIYKTTSSFPLPKNSRNFISLNKTSSSTSTLFLGNSSSSTLFSGNSNGNRILSMAVSASEPNGGTQTSSFQGGESFFRSVLASMEAVYLNRNPTAKAILELVHSIDTDSICYDHLAFRTLRVNGHGIDSLAKFFLDFGYSQQDELRFPAKKLKALWFSPPNIPFPEGGSRVNGPLPRIFISELLVDQMSSEAQEIISKYTEISGNGYNHAALASALGSLTWGKPSRFEFLQLARESEYAAWTLVNGYALNHVTISAHRLQSQLRNIKSLNQFIEENGFKLNSEGSVLKVSPDGLLLQSSTVADSVSFEFSEGITEPVPCSYIEFAERLVLPQYKSIPEEEIKEFHRRDGFEVGNADKIFESTSQDQLTRRLHEH